MSEHFCAECERDWMICPDCHGSGIVGDSVARDCDWCDGMGEVLRDQ